MSSPLPRATASALRATLLALLLATLTGCGRPGSAEPPSPAPKKAALALPDACLGTFTGQTPGYAMRDQAGEVIRINGTTIDVPAIENTVVISRDTIRMTQEADGRVVRGAGPTRILRADAEAVVLEAEILQEKTARPTYRITFDLARSTITLNQVGLNAEPPTTTLVRATAK